MSNLKIVWRNSNAAKSMQRWRTVKRGDGSSTYVIQQFMSKGALGYWFTITGLEVVRGGRVA